MDENGIKKIKLWSMLTISLWLIFKSHRLLSEIALQVSDLQEGGGGGGGPPPSPDRRAAGGAFFMIKQKIIEIKWDTVIWAITWW
jgi:hypothetical protein